MSPQPPMARSARDRAAVGLGLLAFLLMASYSVARPAVESLFVAAQGAQRLPGAWLVTALVTPFVVTAYGRALGRVDLMRLYGGISAGSAGLMLVLLGGVALRLPGSEVALYVWKEIYMVVLVELYYTYANGIFPLESARRLYGWFGVAGALGGIGANLAVGYLAASLGTVGALLGGPVLLGAGTLVALGLARRVASPGVPAARVGPSGLREAARIVRASRYLLLLLALIALVQVVAALVDYRFNAVLEVAYPDTDQRTGIVGQVYAFVSALTVILHAASGPLLRLTGVPAMMIGIPILLGGFVVALAVAPGVATASLLKVADKSLDYTLFRNAKELLYIPLDPRQRALGKSVVDMLTYRVAKVAAAFLALGVVALGFTDGVNALLALVVLAWLGIAVAVVRRFRRLAA